MIISSQFVTTRIASSRPRFRLSAFHAASVSGAGCWCHAYHALPVPGLSRWVHEKAASNKKHSTIARRISTTLNVQRGHMGQRQGHRGAATGLLLDRPRRCITRRRCAALLNCLLIVSRYALDQPNHPHSTFPPILATWNLLSYAQQRSHWHIVLRPTTSNGKRLLLRAFAPSL